jgi:hypothetical protein
LPFNTLNEHFDGNYGKGSNSSYSEAKIMKTIIISIWPNFFHPLST